MAKLRVSQMIMVMNNKEVTINDVIYKVSLGDLIGSDGKSYTPRDLGTKWSDIYDGYLASQPSEIGEKPEEEQEATSVVDSVMSEIQEAKANKPQSAKKEPTKSYQSSGNLEYYTTINQKAVFMELLSDSSSEAVKKIIGVWGDNLTKPSVVRVTHDEIVEINRCFEEAIVNKSYKKNVSSMRAKHEALMSRNA